MTNEDLRKQLEVAKAKRKPPLSDEEKASAAERAKLQKELEAELRALREEENEEICAKHSPTKATAFFDFDPDMVHPSTIEFRGMTCTLHSRFVVRHANDDDMNAFDDARQAVLDAQQDPARAAEVTRAAEGTTKTLGRRCIVYPEPVKGAGSAQHYMDIEASLHYFGGASMALGNAAAQLGGLHALMRQDKS